MKLADSGEGAADEVDALLVEEIRRLGKTTMESWAGEAEQKPARDFKQQNPGSRYGKKRTTELVLCLWSGAERVWRTPSTSYEAPLAKRIGGRSRKLRRVLSDFGIDESFAKAAKKMQEHYGFGVTAVAVRKATLESAAKAERRHEQQCAKDYRRLPGKGPTNIIAEADGSMICTVKTSSRTRKRPRQWEEIRLAAAQVHGQT